MKLLVKIIYKPFGIVFGVLSGLVARRAFTAGWALIDDQKPPKPDTAETTWPKVIAAAALKAVTFSVAKAVTDRWAANSFRYLFGVWPGDRHPPGAED